MHMWKNIVFNTSSILLNVKTTFTFPKWTRIITLTSIHSHWWANCSKTAFLFEHKRAVVFEKQDQDTRQNQSNDDELSKYIDEHKDIPESFRVIGTPKSN